MECPTLGCQELPAESEEVALFEDQRQELISKLSDLTDLERMRVQKHEESVLQKLKKEYYSKLLKILERQEKEIEESAERWKKDLETSKEEALHNQIFLEQTLSILGSENITHPPKINNNEINCQHICVLKAMEIRHQREVYDVLLSYQGEVELTVSERTVLEGKLAGEFSVAKESTRAATINRVASMKTSESVQRAVISSLSPKKKMHSSPNPKSAPITPMPPHRGLIPSPKRVNPYD